MLEFDLTVSITAVLAVCAIISPILTTIINNRYQLKIKKMDLLQKEREETILYTNRIFEEYLANTGSLLYNPTSAGYEKYGCCYSKAIFYAPETIRVEMSRLDDKILSGVSDHNDRSAASSYLYSIAKHLREETTQE